MVKIKCRMESNTPRAILIVDSLGNKHWLPISLINIVKQKGTDLLIECPRWLAEKDDIPYVSEID